MAVAAPMLVAYQEWFFFSSRRRHTRSLCDWSSDVCSSDLSRTRDVRCVRRASSGAAGVAAGISRVLELGDNSGGRVEDVDGLIGPIGHVIFVRHRIHDAKVKGISDRAADAGHGYRHAWLPVYAAATTICEPKH